MFNSIKSKIIVITLGIFAIFGLIVFGIETRNYQSFKQTRIDICRNKVEKFESLVNENIHHFESNARALALSAASFYYYDRKNHSFTDFLVRDNFKQHYEHSDGCGIWFEPYAIAPSKLRYCSYASLKDGNVILDVNCESEGYDYLSKPWYKNVKDNFTAENRDDVFWSSPYYDEIGTKALMITAAAPVYDKKKNFVGLATADWTLDTIIDELDNVRPTPNSIILLADRRSDFVIALRTPNEEASEYTGKSLSSIPWYNDSLKDSSRLKYNSLKYITFKREYDNGMIIVANIPEVEIFGEQKNNLVLGAILRFLSALLFAWVIYIVLTRNVNRPINLFIAATKEIGQGNFEKKIKIKKPAEFVQLANTFNKMTDEIQDYIEKTNKLTLEKRQIEYDLNIAKQIQISSLPSVFPPFPDIVSLDLYAMMKPAKQVGGDFYDFYFIDKSHILFMVADVSGKGVPAALFMMRAKSVFKTMALSAQIPEIIISKANNAICEHNEKGFFVTVGMGIIDINSGEVVYINAGHNPPIIKHSQGAEYLSVPANFVVGIFENINFEVSRFKLNPMDTIFLYTDGVTEAVNLSKQFYGSQRLIERIKEQDTSPKHMIKSLSDDIGIFAQDAEQADDITMVALTYLGNENLIKKIHVPAEISEFKPFMEWLGKLCEKCGMQEGQKRKLLVAAEEIFVNIAYYAYPDKLKDKIQETTITFKYIKPLNEVFLVFTDSGIPYNPLKREDPDITKSLEERSCGGLGILMVKQMMDSVEYEYKNKQNVLILKCKTFKEEA